MLKDDCTSCNLIQKGDCSVRIVMDCIESYCEMLLSPIEVSNGFYIYLFLYVNDMLITTKNMIGFNDLKVLLQSEFEIKD